MIFTTNEELNTALYEKLFEEQEGFRGELLGMAPQEILDRAYEFVVREDILLAMEYNDLSDRQCKALLSSEAPLSELFGAWERHEGCHMEEIRDVIESHANKLIREKFLKDRGEAR